MTNAALFKAANAFGTKGHERLAFGFDCAVELIRRAISSREDAVDASRQLQQLSATAQALYKLPAFLKSSAPSST
jgi:hypothetical protein